MQIPFFNLCEGGLVYRQRYILWWSSFLLVMATLKWHNPRIWSNENPQEIQERPLHSPHVTVWCGITASAVFGLYFFETDDGTTSSVNDERYRTWSHTEWWWEIFLILRIKRRSKSPAQSLFSTGWTNKPYSKRNNGIVDEVFYKSFKFTIWYRLMASSFPRFDSSWLFSVGMP